MREWTFIDKAKWGDGPWTDEPDKVQWVDDATGYDCLIRRGPGGALCGYVGVPPGHPAHGKDYNDVYTFDELGEASIDVHGGLTYSAACDGDEETGICHVTEPGRPEDVWWLGFDCAHSWDLTPRHAALSDWPRHPDERYRDRGYVEREVARLATQLAGMR